MHVYVWALDDHFNLELSPSVWHHLPHSLPANLQNLYYCISMFTYFIIVAILYKNTFSLQVYTSYDLEHHPTPTPSTYLPLRLLPMTRISSFLGELGLKDVSWPMTSASAYVTAIYWQMTSLAEAVIHILHLLNLFTIHKGICTFS